MSQEQQGGRRELTEEEETEVNRVIGQAITNKRVIDRLRSRFGELLKGVDNGQVAHRLSVRVEDGDREVIEELLDEYRRISGDILDQESDGDFRQKRGRGRRRDRGRGGGGRGGGL